MALNKPTLKAAIKAAFVAEKDSEDNLDQSLDNIADAIADAVDAYIKSATITVPAGIPVTTAGSASNQTGATTAPQTATIN